MTTVVVVEDRALIRGALVALLGLADDITVVGQAGRVAEAVSVLSDERPHVCLLDIDLPDGDGIDAIGAFRKVSPSTHFLIVTTFARPGYLVRAMEAGATGFVLKDAPSDHMASAVTRVAAGERVIDADLAREAVALGANPLSAREQEALLHVLTGSGAAEAAARMFLARGTVRNYLSQAMDKTATTSATAAAREAERRGWLPRTR